MHVGRFDWALGHMESEIRWGEGFLRKFALQMRGLTVLAWALTVGARLDSKFSNTAKQLEDTGTGEVNRQDRHGRRKEKQSSSWTRKHKARAARMARVMN